MSYNRLQLYTYVVNKAKIPASDTVSLGMINDDLNDAINVVAGKRFWPQLQVLSNINLGAKDGDIAYALSTNVYRVEQMRITSPLSYSRELTYVPVEILRRLIPNKLIPGYTVPSRWTYYEPVLTSDNAEIKQVSFDYRPDQAYTIAYSYQSYPPLMVLDTNYPFFDEQYHRILAYYAIWNYAERVKQPSLSPNYWLERWELGLERIKGDFQGQTKELFQIPGPDIGAP